MTINLSQNKKNGEKKKNTGAIRPLLCLDFAVNQGV